MRSLAVLLIIAGSIIPALTYTSNLLLPGSSGVIESEDKQEGYTNTHSFEDEPVETSVEEGSARQQEEEESDREAEVLTCDSEMFRCWDGSLCIPKNATCSGLAECPDESDEAVSQCGCLTNEYQCKNTCIDVLRRCDTVADCDQAEDEQHCETWVCPESHYKCTNDLCVPSDAMCNFVDDCGDNSDEHQCDYRKCFYSEFTCVSGECIRPGLVCDGILDCIDGTDETQCQPEDFVECTSGRRVHRFYWCDGWPDCADNHADELHCGACGKDEFLCSNTQCVALGNVCDSQCDCTDCADEQDCAAFYSSVSGVAVCEVGAAITCVVSTNKRNRDRCVAADNLCDGFNHCQNGDQISDETGCGSSQRCEMGAGEEEAWWFPCSDGRCIPSRLRCDWKVDCLHGEDEKDCPVSECDEEQWQCASGQCVHHNDRCDLHFDCYDKSDEMNCSEHQCESGEVKCHTGQCLPRSFWCDHNNDCPDKSDELYCEKKIGGCEPEGFLCASGQCIPREERCIISSDRHHGCVDDSHLLDCKSMECPAGMYKCRSGPCYDATKQCDGFIHCPETWDDEDFCPFQCSRQVPECRCHHLEADCSGLDLQYFPDIEKNINRFVFSDNNLSVSLHQRPIQGYDRIVYLDLSRNHIKYLNKGTFKHLWRLRILILSENNITSLSEGVFDGLHNLRTLHLNGNQIATLSPVAFSGLTALPTLDLSHQRLASISPRAFVGLRNLSTLSLSQNQLALLDDAAFTGLRHLKKLDLTHNTIVTFSNQLFHHIPRLHHLETDEWRLCCLARHVEKCLPEADEFSSCEDLMSNLVLRVCIWILGFTALLGNSFVIIWRSLYSSGNKMHSFLIVNLGVGDFLMGVYLVIVAAVDLQYRGVYAAYELSWRTSALCQLAGFISTFSSELSVFTLTVITVDRLIVIKFPFGVRMVEGGVTRMVMVWVWLLVGFLSALPLTHLEYFGNFYGRSGVCLALHITNEKPNGWEYAVFIFLVLNLLSFGMIAVSYVLMYVAAKDTQTAVRTRTESGGGDRNMAKRMTLIVATDAACWLPIIFLGIASLCGVTIPAKVFSWIAVFVLPLNAAINPVLYTLSTAPVRKRLRHLRRGVSTVHSKSASAVSGGRLVSSFKMRISTDVTDLGQATDSETRVNAKSSVCVYTPAAPVSTELSRCVLGTPERSRQETDNGPGESLLAALNGGEGIHMTLSSQDSSEVFQECSDPGAMELVPLEELTTALTITKKSSSRKNNKKKNFSDNRYD